MKVTLEFNMPEERGDHDLAMAAHELAANLSAIRDHVRLKLKHGILTNGQARELEEVKALIDYALLDRVGY